MSPQSICFVSIYRNSSNTTHKASVVPYRAFKTSDGDFLVGGGNDRLFGLLCKGLGKPEWTSDDRFITNDKRVENRNVLEPWIEEITKSKTTQEWLDIFDGTGLPYAKVNDLLDTVNHKHGMTDMSPNVSVANCNTVLARNMIQEIDHPACGPLKLINTPVKYSYSTPGIRIPPPTLGQDTDIVLKDILHKNEDDIKSLRTNGVVG